MSRWLWGFMLLLVLASATPVLPPLKAETSMESETRLNAAAGEVPVRVFTVPLADSSPTIMHEGMLRPFESPVRALDALDWAALAAFTFMLTLVIGIWVLVLRQRQLPPPVHIVCP
jgi:hypothetical protein